MTKHPSHSTALLIYKLKALDKRNIPLCYLSTMPLVIVIKSKSMEMEVNKD